ncbi:hypothetical protein ILYODFUR_026768 [Ilyodon furcidens]|uniref:Uncharacterized protein n=1 Tax=Ilyodon furcidens TaxID=33524 RepID=A0ABV0ST03_9TELE
MQFLLKSIETSENSSGTGISFFGGLQSSYATQGGWLLAALPHSSPAFSSHRQAASGLKASWGRRAPAAAKVIISISAGGNLKKTLGTG